MRKHFLFLVLCAMTCVAALQAQNTQYAWQTGLFMWHEGFEGGVLPTGWTQSDATGNATWIVEDVNTATYPSHVYAGTYRASVKNPGNLFGASVRLVTSTFDLSNVTGPHLTFALANQATAAGVDTLRVYYRVANSQEWLLLETCSTPTSGNTWRKYDLNLIANTNQLAFEYIDGSGRGMGLDDIKILNTAVCEGISNVQVAPESTTAEVNWSGSFMADHFEYVLANAQMSLDSVTTNSASVVVSGTTTEFSYTFTGLTADQTYYVYLRSTCDDNESGFTPWVEAEISTYSQIALPYAENFNSVTNNSMLQGWTRGTDYTSTNVPFVNGAVASKYYYSVDSTAALSFSTNSMNAITVGKYAYAVTPLVNTADLSQIEVSFWGTAYTQTEAAKGAHLYVGTMTNPKQVESFHLIDSVTVDATYQFKHFTVAFDNYVEGNGRYIAFLSPADKENLFVIDNLNIQTASIFVPTDVQVNSLHKQGFNLAANVHGAQAYNVRIFDAADYVDGGALPTATPLVSLNNQVGSITVNDAALLGQTVIVYVQAANGSATSAWAHPVVVRMPQVISEVPTTWGFEDAEGIMLLKNLVKEMHYNLTTSVPTSYWAPISRHLATYPAASSTRKHNGNKSLSLPANQYVVLGELANLNFADLQLMMYTAGAAGAKLEIGVMADPMTINSFTTVHTIELEEAVTAMRREIAPLDSYTGNYKYVALRNAGTVSFYVDDISLMNIPTCREPKDVHTSAVGSSTATIEWDGLGMSQWLVTVYEGSNTNSEPVVETLVSAAIANLTGLTSGTQYTYTVEAVCGNDTTDSEKTYSFRTVLGVPYAENFTNGMPAGWTRMNGLASDAFNGTLPVTTTSGWTNTSSNVPAGMSGNRMKVNIYSTSCKYWLVMPELLLTAEAGQLVALTFDAAWTKYASTQAPTETSDDDKFMVLISTDGGASWSQNDATIWANDGTGQHAVNDIPATATNISIDLTQYIGQSIVIAFYGESTQSGGDNDFNIDNIKVGYVDADCQGLQTLSTSAPSSTEAAISWVAAGSQANMSVVVEVSTMPTFETTIYSQTTTDNPIQLTGLTEQTTYYVRARQACDEDADWKQTSFMTPCNAVANPLAYFENFSDASNMDCWFTGFMTIGNSSYYAKADRESDANFGSHLTLSKSSVNTTDYEYNDGAYAVMPAMATDSINKYQVVFKAATNSLSAENKKTVTVGVVSDPNDMSSFTEVRTVEVGFASDSTGMLEYTASLATYEGDYNGDFGRYIAFVSQAGTDATNIIYIDDVYLELVSNCAQVLTSAVDSLGSDFARFTWEGTGAAQYEVAVFDGHINTINAADAVQTTTVTTTSTIITGLQPNTPYTISVRAICDANNSAKWSTPVQFQTECIAITTLPWSENFDTQATGTFKPDCWTNEHIAGSGTSLFTISSSTLGDNQTNKLQLPDMSAGTKTRLTLPVVNIPTANTYGFSLDIFRSNSYLTKPSEGIRVLAVGMDGVEHELAFVPRPYTAASDSVDAVTAEGWYTYQFAIPVAGDVHIVLIGESDYGTATYVDNLAIDLMPTCMPAKKLTVSGLTESAATLSWKGAMANYIVEVSASVNFSPVDTFLVADTTLALTNLAPNTKYYIRLTKDCGNGDLSEVSVPTSFKTMISLPFAEDFQASTSIPDDWARYSGVLGAGSTTTSGWTVTSSAGGAGLLANHVYCSAYHYQSSSSDTYYKYALVTPTILVNSPAGNSVFLGFDMGLTTSSTGTTAPTEANKVGHTFQVVVSENGGNTWDMANAYTWGDSLANESYDSIPATAKHYTLDLSQYAGKSIQIAFYHAVDSTAPAVTTSSTYIHLDNISLESVNLACLAPVVVVDSVSLNSVSVSWDGDETSTYVAEISTTAGFASVAASQTLTGVNNYTFTNLSSSTRYYVRVKVLCSEALESSWSSVVSAITACDVFSQFPWSEDFENVAAGVVELPCWTNVEVAAGTGTSGVSGKLFQIYTSSSGSNSTHQLQLPDMKAGTITRLTLPEMQFAAANAYEFSLDIYRNATSFATEGVRVIVLDQTGAEHELTFISRNYQTAGALVPAETASGWYTYHLTIPVAGVAQIVLQGESQYGNSTNMDNLMVDLIPSCVTPSAPVAISVGQDSAVIAWEGQSDSYLLHMESANDTIDAQTTEAQYTIHGLSASSVYTYTISLRGICGQDTSAVSTTTLSVMTECGVTAIPWQTSFEEYATGSSSSPAPQCWDMLNANEGTYPYMYVNTSTSYVHTGAKSLYFVSSTSEDAFAIMPEFDTPLNELSVQFSYRHESTSSSGDLYLGYITDPTDETTFVPVGVVSKSTTWQTVRANLISIPAEVASTARLAFAYGGGSSDNYYLGLDDLIITRVPMNETVASVTAQNITRREFDLTWELAPYADCDTVELVISTAAMTADSLATAEKIVLVDTNAYHVSGLERNTNYYVYVRTSCMTTDGAPVWKSTQVKTEALTACEDVVIAAGSETSQYVPVFGYWADSNQKTQMLYPASMLTDLVGMSFSSMTFYVSSGSNASKWDGSTFNVRMGSTTASNLANGFVATPSTLAYSGSLTANPNDNMVVNFSRPFTYTGGNLLIEFEQPISSTYGTVYFYGMTAQNASGYAYGTNAETIIDFLPTFSASYCYPLPACPAIETINYEYIGDGTTSARISWSEGEGDYAGSYDFYYSETPVANLDSIVPLYSNIDSTSVILTGLNVYTEYYVYVRSNCDAEGHDDGSSVWASRTFRTSSLCAVVTDIEAEILGPTSVHLTWGETVQDNNFQYIVSTTALNNDELEAATLTASGLATAEATLTALEPGATYYVYVANVCDDGSHSPYQYVTFEMPNPCPAIGNLHTTYVAYNTVGLAWDKNQYGQETSWEVGVVGHPELTQTVSTQSATIVGLIQSSDYTFYVRALCDEENVSAMVTLAVSTPAQPGNEVTLGMGTADAYLVYTFCGNSFSQHIYTAEELTAMGYGAGNINAIAFDYRSSSSTFQKQQTMYIGHTTLDEFTGSSAGDLIDASQLQSVYGPEVNTLQQGWVTYGLVSPFYWDGVSNIVVAMLSVQPDGESHSYSTNWDVNGTTQDLYRTVVRYGDNTAIDPSDVAGTSSYGTRSIVRPNAIFSFDAESCLKPANLHADTVGTDMAHVTWYPGGYETQWVVTIADHLLSDVELESATLAVDTVNVMEHTFTGLQQSVDYYVYARSICSATSVSSWARLLVPTAATCLVPEGLTVAEHDAYSATLRWLGNGVSTYSVAYGVAATFNLNESSTYQVVEVSDTTALIQGLTPATAYAFVVRANCDANEHSRWSSSVMTTTECAVITTLPWSEDFNALTSGIPNCWDNSVGTMTSADNKWNYYATGVTGSGLRMDSYFALSGQYNVLATPEFQFSEAAMLSFTWKNPTGGNFKVLVSADNGQTYVTLADNMVGQADWAIEELDLSGFVGQTIRVYFHGTSNYGSGDANIYLDDVMLYAAPTCRAPFFTVSDITTTSATINWTEAGTYDIQVSTTEDFASVVASASVNSGLSYSLTGLGGATTYYVRMRSHCSATELSDWTRKPVAFTTDCGVISNMPWFEGFEGFQPGSSTSDAPRCWNMLNCNEGTFPYMYVNTATGYVHSGAKSLYFQSSSSVFAYAILPEFADNLSTLKISFWYRMESATYSGDLALGYMTDPSDENSFVPVAVYERITTMTQAEEVLTSIPAVPAGTRLAFRYGGGPSSNYYLGIDDISVTRCESVNYEATTCAGEGYHDGHFDIEPEMAQDGDNTFSVLLPAADENAVDTVFVLTLHQLPTATKHDAKTYCEGEMILDYDINMPATVSRQYNRIFAGAAANGCDSIVILDVTVIPAAHTEIHETICEGEAYSFNGENLYVAGVYVATFSTESEYHCDSIVTLFLEVSQKVQETIDEQVCFGETYTFNGQTLNASGTYTATFTSAIGCDSIVTLNLTIMPEAKETVVLNMTAGETYTDDHFVGVVCPGTYTAVTKNELGCDSTITLILQDPTGLELLSNGQLRLTPNPVAPSQLISISSTNGMDGAQVIIYDAVGHMVSRETLEGTTIVAPEAQGMYMVTIKRGNETYVGKLLVQ